MIKFLVDIITSKRDTHGNCYHAASITRVSDNLTLCGMVDAAPNVRGYLYTNGMARIGENEIHETETVLPIRQFNRLTKNYKHIDGDQITLFFKLHERI